MARHRRAQALQSPPKSLLRVLDGEPVWPPPIWLMRQAGRYLPEYRELRAKAGSFLDLCYTPSLAAEVTLQPIRRFGFDGAILFSDILVVPHALGQDVRFVEGEGPRLDPVTTEAELSRLADELPLERLAPVFETLERVKAALPAETTLLGFCGAPWTVASYMVGGRGTPDLAPVRQAAAADPAFLDRLIDRLVEASTAYLVRQLEAGAEAVQIFESHAGVLGGADLERWSLRPIRRIVDGVRAKRPEARVIVFARGARGRPRAGRTGHGRQRDRARPGRRPAGAPAHAAAGAADAGQSRSRNAGRRRRGFGPGRGRHPARRCAAGRTSSTSATASCRRPRSPMSSAWWRGCAPRARDGGNVRPC